MKLTIKILILLLVFTSCEKNEDDLKDLCTENCTTLSGKFFTANNEPVPNITVTLNYRISGGELGGGATRKIVKIKSDKNGNIYKNFYLKDSELGNNAMGYFDIKIDDSGIDVNKYIRTDNLIGPGSSFFGSAIYSITNRDTIINLSCYFPKKAYIKVNLNNFIPEKTDDSFEVQTLYPFGGNVGYNEFLDSPYGTGFSGYGNWTAKNLNNNLNVFVAEGEKNIIRVIKRKNGVGSSEDFEVYVPSNNSIELTYDY